jgi:hypothetical protein
MQCCLVFEVIDGYEVVVHARERTRDPVETYKYVREKFPNAKADEIERLFEEHKQYAPLQKNEKPLQDNTCHQLQEKLTSLGKHEILLTDGTIIPNYNGNEYWKKKDGRWIKDKIQNIGMPIPAGAILVDELNSEQYAEQYQEITKQTENERIAGLTKEEVAKELQSALDALADEAARLEKRAQIQRNVFDPVAWYEEEKQKIQEKYGISNEL